MANNNQNQSPNQTMRHEQAKGSVGGGSDSRGQQGGFDQNRSQQGGMDQNREKGAIGGGENRSQTGEPGRARSELEEGQTGNR